MLENTPVNVKINIHDAIDRSFVGGPDDPLESKIKSWPTNQLSVSGKLSRQYVAAIGSCLDFQQDITNLYYEILMRR